MIFVDGNLDTNVRVVYTVYVTIITVYTIVTS